MFCSPLRAQCPKDDLILHPSKFQSSAVGNFSMFASHFKGSSTFPTQPLQCLSRTAHFTDCLTTFSSTLDFVKSSPVQFWSFWDLFLHPSLTTRVEKLEKRGSALYAALADPADFSLFYHRRIGAVLLYPHSIVALS